MAVKWRTERAEAFCASVRDGTHDSPKAVENGQCLVTSRHITRGRLDLANAYLISQEDFDAINKRSKVDQWDVLISMIGTVGEPCLVKEEPHFAIKNIGLFKSKGEVEGKWLYYYLLSPQAEQLIHEQARGTTQQYIPLGTLRKFPIPVPGNADEMRAITHILGTLDDKIEVNRRTNDTLAAMAGALFKSWFVNFDPVRAKFENRDARLPKPVVDLFPARLLDSELGEIPEGWEVGSILNHARLLSGGTPKTDRPEYWDGLISWASAKDVSQSTGSFLVETERTITDQGLNESATQVVPALCSVVVARGATTGRMVLFGRDMAMNQTCYALATNTGTPFALYCRLRNEIDTLVHAAHGSVFDTITTNTFASSRVVLPPERVLKAFEACAAPVFHRVLGSTHESRTLAALRDTLLPKLMSGEMRVNDAKRCVESVGA